MWKFWTVKLNSAKKPKRTWVRKKIRKMCRLGRLPPGGGREGGGPFLKQND